jgi:hypothetical protein
LRRQAFAHGPTSSEFKAAFGDADAGLGDSQHRLH